MHASFFVLLMFVFQSTWGQESESRKGRNSVNLYAGTNVRASLLRGLTSKIPHADVTGMPNIGITYDHMVSDHVGIGLEVTHAQMNVTWVDTINTSQTGPVPSNLRYTFAMSRIMFRLNAVVFSDSNFDVYILLSAGYRHATREMSADVLEHDLLKYLEGKKISLPNPVPFGVKPGIGFRYFFTRNFGLHMELAAGTPLVSGGLSVKF